MRYKYDDTINPKTGKGAHSHLLDLKDTGDFKRLTGTSSVVDVLSKVLTWWASGLAVKTLGWTDPKIKKNGKEVGKVPVEERILVANQKLEAIKKMSPTEYLALLDDAYKAHSVNLKDTASAGTDLHAELEQFVKSKMGLNDRKRFDPVIKPFIKWSEHAVKKFLWSEVHCFSEYMWVGGISDAGCILNGHTIETPDGQVEIPDGTLAVIDFKSAKETYTSQFIQGAGYALQIEENGLRDKDGKLIEMPEEIRYESPTSDPRYPRFCKPFQAIVIVAFGKDIVYPEVRMHAAEYKEGFKHALALYRLLGMDKSEYKK